MAKRWEENFDALLNWLDPDRDRAGAKHEEIRESLINIFSWRGFKDAEELADETINRVAIKVPALVEEYQGDPAIYFYAVAKNLCFEAYRREQRLKSLPENPAAEPPKQIEDDKPEFECLDRCLEKLPSTDRELILLYYQQDEPKIRHRKQLATNLRCTPNTIRLRAYRIRITLFSCMEKCLAAPR